MLTTLFSRLVLTFGDRPLPTKTVVEETVLGCVLLVPFGIFLGHATMRLCCHPPAFVLKYVRADVWNTMWRLLIADVMMELLLPSIQCLPLSQEFGYSISLLLQTYGLICPTITTPPIEEGIHYGDPTAAVSLSPVATGIVFAMRLGFVCLGVHIGESFAPIGLTGSIACGKSTVAKLLLYDHIYKTEGGMSSTVLSDGTVYLVDTDTIAHEILLPDTADSVYQAVVDTFGSDILEPRAHEDDFLSSRPLIDRRKLGNVIFQNATQRRRLNSITHPRILLVMLKRMMYGLFWSNKDVCIVDVPLLYETGKPLTWLFVQTVLVACSPETQLERLWERSKQPEKASSTAPALTKEQCQQRINSQMEIRDKVAMADLVIWNEGSLEELENQVEQTRGEIMNRVYGVGLSLLQLLIIIGGSVPLAVMSKLYSLRASE